MSFMTLWLSELINDLKSFHLEVFYKKSALKYLVKFKGTNLCLRLFFNKVAIKWHIKMVSSKVFYNSCLRGAVSRSQLLKVLGANRDYLGDSSQLWS